MTQITTQHLAQLMIGVARSQLAVVDSVENMKAGFKFTHVRPTLETASRIRSNHPETLADFPSRLLLQMLGWWWCCCCCRCCCRSSGGGGVVAAAGGWDCGGVVAACK